jgi:hypothetical protein
MHGHGFGQCEEQMHILQLEFHEFNKFQNHLTTHMNLVVRMYALETFYSLETFLLYFENFEWNEKQKQYGKV